jgi:hypothetical protein
MSIKYSLDIVSHHPEFAGKTLKKYQVDGIETVGTYGDEKFSVVFKNHTSQKVQVVISLDGTNISNGKPATTESSADSWAVAAYRTLTLSAWRESDDGGAAFVFTNADNGVAVHTHGDTSSRGIIAAAVFVEGYVQPPLYQPIYVNYPYYWHTPYWNDWYPYYNIITCNTTNIYDGGSVMMNNGMNSGTIGSTLSSNSLSTQNIATNNEVLPAVGAGEYTQQKVNYTSGLVQPILNEVIKVKYIWWSELENKLKAGHIPSQQASGFPGDQRKGIDLSNVSRVISEKKNIATRVDPIFSRV